MTVARMALEAERLRLEPVESRHASEVYEAASSSRAHLLPWMPWADEQSLEQVRGFIARAEAGWADGSLYDFAIVIDGRARGIVSLSTVHPGICEIGYWIAAEQAGQGLVPDAARRALAFAFGELRLYRVELRAGVDNHRSLRVAEKLGFALEGTLRDGLDGSTGPFDCRFYGMTRSAWAAVEGSG
jgi:ribosomal-protein-serine acetyltransferase